MARLGQYTMMKRKITAALAGLVALAGASQAAAAVTYHFQESTDIGNATGGVFSGPGGVTIYNPFTFDFTVATALAANTTYNFTAANLLPVGDSGKVLGFTLSDGTALSTFSDTDFPAMRAGYRGGPAASDTASIHVQTDATGAITLYDILIIGRSTVRPNDVIYFLLQHDTPNAGIAMVEAAYNYGPGYYNNDDGDIRCVVYCSGSFSVAQDAGGVGAGAAPEAATWALMIAGFGGAGAMLRRRRAGQQAA